jgi:hypothetical protein
MQFNATVLPTIVSNGQLSDAVLHEMHHVLGFGTLWTAATPALIINAGTPETAYTGAAAMRGCQQAGGVPTDCVPRELVLKPRFTVTRAGLTSAVP